MATITRATTHVGVYSKVGPSSAMSMPLSLPKSNFRQTYWAKKKIKCENLWGLALNLKHADQNRLISATSTPNK